MLVQQQLVEIDQVNEYGQVVERDFVGGGEQIVETLVQQPMVEIDQVNAYGQVVERDFVGGATYVETIAAPTVM
jgi:hypothetical protein